MGERSTLDDGVIGAGGLSIVSVVSCPSRFFPERYISVQF
jgi:hypothetical protein